jgi:hypothetical protein
MRLRKGPQFSWTHDVLRSAVQDSDDVREEEPSREGPLMPTRGHPVLARRTPNSRLEWPIHCRWRSAGVPSLRSRVTRECRNACKPALGMPSLANSGCNTRFLMLALPITVADDQRGRTGICREFWRHSVLQGTHTASKITFYDRNCDRLVRVRAHRRDSHKPFDGWLA